VVYRRGRKERERERKREREKEHRSPRAANSVPPQIIVTFVRTRVDRPNFARSGKTTIRGQFLERPALHHRLLVISLSMVETPFDYPRLRRGTTRYKSSVGWYEAEMVVRVADSCEQHSGFRAGDRLNAVEEAPTDTLLARFLIRISVLSIARGRTYIVHHLGAFLRKRTSLQSAVRKRKLLANLIHNFR